MASVSVIDAWSSSSGRRSVCPSERRGGSGRAIFDLIPKAYPRCRRPSRTGNRPTLEQMSTQSDYPVWSLQDKLVLRELVGVYLVPSLTENNAMSNLKLGFCFAIEECDLLLQCPHMAQQTQFCRSFDTSSCYQYRHRMVSDLVSRDTFCCSRKIWLIGMRTISCAELEPA